MKQKEKAGILYSTKDLLGYRNELTEELDKFCVFKHGNCRFYNYLVKFTDSLLLIRYPGATRGCVEVDGNGFIKKIELYKNDALPILYKEAARETIQRFIGFQILFIGGKEYL